jgi:hypothetical protein
MKDFDAPSLSKAGKLVLEKTNSPHFQKFEKRRLK